MTAGKLLPSSTILALVKKQMANSPGNFVALDGFPRSAENCQDFAEICGQPECAFYIELPDDVMIERILKRGQDSGRADDNLETAMKRLETFHTQGKATLDYLYDSGVDVHVGFQRSSH